MASMGPNSAGTISAVVRSGGVQNWTNPSNAGSSDNSYAYVNIEGSSGYSYYLKLVNFGFSIPTGSTIDGIEVKIEKYANISSGSAYVTDSQLKLYKGGTLVGNDLSDIDTKWATSESVITYGGSSNLWGETWTAEDINASDFGVGFSAYLAAAAKVFLFGYVDHITITVYYTAGGGGGSSTNALLYIGN